MDCERIESVASLLDFGLIADLVRELAGARRNVSSYPKGHPVVVQSCERAAEIAARVCADLDELVLGVTRDNLLVNEGPLATLVPAARNFARALAYHGVSLIRLRKGVVASEIEVFSQVLAEKRSSLADRGGIEEILHKAGVLNLGVSVIQYDAFHAADALDADGWQASCSHTLWEKFTLTLLKDLDLAISYDHEMLGRINPGAIAGVLNGLSSESLNRITAALEELVRSTNGLADLSADDRSSLEKIGEVIDMLKPEQQKQLFCDVLRSYQEFGPEIMEIVPYLPTSSALELYKRSRETRVILPSHILDTMELLAEAAGHDPVPGRSVSGMRQGWKDDRLSIIFREESVDEFVPAEYLETLKLLISSQDNLSMSSRDLQELIDNLGDERIESVVSGIILESLPLAGPEQLTVLMRNLRDLCSYFLKVGDFASLESTYRRLVWGAYERDEQLLVREDVVAFFHAPEFAEEILDGVEHWGKEKFDEVGVLIQVVGEPFIEPLLDRLAEESRIAFRRYYLDQLLMMADQAKEAVCARLGDNRWYVVRNLVIILQHSCDQQALHHIQKVVDFPHPKVRQRVIEAFQFFGDPEGDRLLLQDLASSDSEVRLVALLQAGKSMNPDVVTALAAVLMRKGLSPMDITEKKAAIQALGEIGDSRVLPVLDRILSARHFFKVSLRNMLKQEILHSLTKYRDPLATVLLQKASTMRNKELSRLALGNLLVLEKENG